MASQHKDAILHSLLEIVRAYNAHQDPGIIHGFGQCRLEAKMPLSLNNQPDAPLPCREPAADFDTVNAHFSAQKYAAPPRGIPSVRARRQLVFSSPRGEDSYATGFAVTREREENYAPGQDDEDKTYKVMSDEQKEYWGDAADIL